MSWEWSRTDAGTVTLIDPAGNAVAELEPSTDGRVAYGPSGVPSDPDVRATAAQHLAAKYQAGDVSLATGIMWAMEGFDERP